MNSNNSKFREKIKKLFSSPETLKKYYDLHKIFSDLEGSKKYLIIKQILRKLENKKQKQFKVTNIQKKIFLQVAGLYKKDKLYENYVETESIFKSLTKRAVKKLNSEEKKKFAEPIRSKKKLLFSRLRSPKQTLYSKKVNRI